MQELQEAIDFYVTNINNFFQKQAAPSKLLGDIRISENYF